MKSTGCSKVCAVFLIATLLAVFPTDTLAKETVFSQGSAPPVRLGRTHAAFNKNNSIGWQWVRAQCTANPKTVDCAQAAVLETSTICGDSAKFFKRGSETWKWIGFTMVLVSAASTAVGASTTIANAKIWSTLGGTTGLGAVTTSVNSNITTDQNALAAINATLASFDTAVNTAGTRYDQIYLVASIYATQCEAIANSSSGTTAPQPSQPTKPGAPTIGVASAGAAGSGTATVTFTASLNSGGGTVMYTVTANPGGATASGASSPITVSGLTAGTTYTFTVTATNSAGTGPSSAASNSINAP